MRSIQDWLKEYGDSHQNDTNKNIHWICVPVIFFSIIGMLFSIKLPLALGGVTLNVAVIGLVFAIIYYVRLSRTLWVGLLLFSSLCLIACHFIELSRIIPLWIFCLILFLLAWVGQFYGHHVEGKKPSFLKDLQFLLIGPAWLMSFIYRKLGISI